MQTFKKLLLFLFINLFILSILSILIPSKSKLKFDFEGLVSENCEGIVLGQSHAEAGMNPYILSEELNISFYNMAISALTTPNVYYILKEANSKNDLRFVIYDLDSGFFGSDGLDGRTNICRDLTGKRKCEYLVRYINQISIFDMYNNYSKDKRSLINLPINIKYFLRGKPTVSLDLKSQYINNSEYEYIGKGFIYGVGLKPNWHWEKHDFNVRDVNNENLETFKDIVHYCQDNDINLICTRSRVTPYRIKNQNTDDIHEFFRDLCNSNNVPFYDMNYIRKEYFNPSQNDFIDQEGHMRGEAADKQSKILSLIIQEKENKEKYFYKEYSDVLLNLNMSGERE